ncbi:HNH endonuclease [Xanthomonas hortorum]|uniref:HNH nuclease domain-containing protein n=1 Tax=Xanthomonas hortorum pv. gardneri TaxID=2754056 RepID=A0A6V7BC13_9XANT|nr:HNH endonuclease signature motif containing protein [Xanthomonas hortorum]APP78662.1 HNH endonuclease [Xanthomonas hortorum pv. gardneri]EGD17606.1 hypothetical protein XGA_3782 [Xanthomonas hortorum ATCC 19865]MCC8498824.1 HNH endonuclease [Xanthomonas hortorum pv. gardneri]MCC8507604.1 HNH endonuclease [Xanthomonas hortorum pv. gardneri]MCC8512067.1 HNH endonuclease [Xanthomonas hortorum pv. gardneri]
MATRKHISTETKLRLFAEAAGHCQHPDCLEKLFPFEMGGDRHIAEIAHVIPYGEKGPRHEVRPPDKFDKNAFENLILLCPTCHTVIDKNSDAYGRSLLLGWKAGHFAALAYKQGIVSYNHRNQVRRAITAAMAENKAIWKQLAPEDGCKFSYDPESDAAQLWSKRMRGIILPNHFRIIAISSLNLHLATGAEHETLASYQEHVRGLVERHVCRVSGTASRFPNAMEAIFL